MVPSGDTCVATKANMRCVKEAYVQEESSSAWFQEVIHVLLPKPT
jgi:hypothetical protein